MVTQKLNSTIVYLKDKINNFTHTKQFCVCLKHKAVKFKPIPTIAIFVKYIYNTVETCSVMY